MDLINILSLGHPVKSDSKLHSDASVISLGLSSNELIFYCMPINLTCQLNHSCLFIKRNGILLLASKK